MSSNKDSISSVGPLSSGQDLELNILKQIIVDNYCDSQNDPIIPSHRISSD